MLELVPLKNSYVAPSVNMFGICWSESLQTLSHSARGPKMVYPLTSLSG